ncbi:28S ribosomal protein S18c, mitochondrial isoform X2 [Cebus imitator]|uniref:28S ribosomal protein S18c, mitochondrial isoform X2 n=1 Tax=Cebus imitator TaxID=2715852 RepID=UPI00080A788D|nr:28S ribosomal protein S18c, mitochondrial isoform X2 [Cebus imitator]
MASMVAACGGLGRNKLTHLVTAAVSLTHPGIHTVLWRRGCSQYKQVSSNEDLPIPMENPYKEPLKKCILCGKRVDYKNVQVFVGRNRKKSQKQLRELKYWGLCQLHTRILHISRTLKFVISDIGNKFYHVTTNKLTLQYMVV